MAVPQQDNPAPRRRWLFRLLEGAFAVTLTTIVYPIVSYLRPREVSGSVGGRTVAPFKASELGAGPEWPPPFEFDGQPCLVIKTPAGDIRAFNAVCTHLSCTVNFRPQQPDIFCPCHNGVFDLDGQVVSGPPPRPLEEYVVHVDGEQIIVSRGSS